jgi:DNA repair photolyase
MTLKKYDKFLQMENKRQADMCGGIDPQYGRYEYWKIGMTRNASEENQKTYKVFLDPAPHVILDQNVPLRGWYKNKHEPKGVRPRPCFTEALLTQPYGGACPVRCAFCYVNNGVRGYRGSGITVVDPNYPIKVEKQLAKMQFGWNAYISSFTEAFQKLEDKFHNTEQLSEVITSYGLPLFYLTRQIPPDWALNYLLKSKYSYQQFSIITSDRTVYRKLSPGAAPLDDILKFIKQELKPRGIYVSIQINPILPGIITKQDILNLIAELGQAGANHCIFKFVEIVTPAAGAMVDKMNRMFPGEKSAEFETLFSQTIGGLRTVKEDYRIRMLDSFAEATAAAGMTMGLCYEYCYDRDESGHIRDKTGVSLGKRYCTGDQCHGFRTPIHVKKSGKFYPLEVCPPSGCLYCEETHKGKKEIPPCGVSKLMRAKALKPSDYNKSYWRFK